MKKLKLFGAAVIAASLILSGCANGADDEVTPEPTKPVVEQPTDPADGTETGTEEGENNEGEDNAGESNEGEVEGNEGENNEGESIEGEAGDNEGEDNEDDDNNDDVTNPALSYSTLTVYGAEENDISLGGTQNWWNGPAFTEENNEIVADFGTAEGSGAYTLNFNVLEDDVITVEYKSEVPAKLRFVTSKECDVATVATEGYKTASYRFTKADEGNLHQIGFIAGKETGKFTVKSITLNAVDTSDALSAAIADIETYLDNVTIGSSVGDFPQDSVDELEAAVATAKAEITTKANRKEWFAAENTLAAALESFKATQVKPTFPANGYDVEGATYIYTSIDADNTSIKVINPDWGQASNQKFEEVTVGDTTRKLIVLNLVNYQGIDLNDVDISNATKLCFEYNTTEASEKINVFPIYTKKAEAPKEYAISWSPVADGKWHTAEITFDKTNAGSADAIDQIKFADGTGKFYYDNLRVE